MIRFYSKQSGRWTDQWSHPALRGYGQDEGVELTNEEVIAIQQETIETQKKTITKNLIIGLALGGIVGGSIGYAVAKRRKR